MHPVNDERKHIHAEMAYVQLFEGYFLQYNNLFFNYELQYLKLINLELYRIIEPFWQGKMYCKFVIVVLIRAGANLLFKILWKLIVDIRKEYLHSQHNTLRQNTELKEKQL